MRNVALLVAIVVAIAAGAHFGFQEANAGTPAFLLYVAVPTVLCAVLGVVRATRDGTWRDWAGVRAGDFSRGFAGAAIFFGVTWAASRWLTPQSSDRESWLARLYLQLGDPATLRKSVAFVVAILILLSIAEEIVWRGLVTSLLSELIGSHRAWVWSAVLYAVAQLPTVYALRDPVAGANPLLVLAALFGGLLWGYMARRFDRLLPSVISHVLFDWTVVMMFRLWGPSV